MRMPRQSKDASMRDLVKVWPRANVGAKIALNFRASGTVVEWKKLVRKEYSKVALSMSARLKWKNGVSRWCICLSSSAR